MKKLFLAPVLLLFVLSAVVFCKRDNQQDCLALARAYIASCVANGQTPDWLCTQQGNGVYCSCMKDRGEQQPQGCSDTKQ